MAANHKVWADFSALKSSNIESGFSPHFCLLTLIFIRLSNLPIPKGYQPIAARFREVRATPPESNF